MGVIPYISLTDLIVFKIECCGKRERTKGETDAIDAEALLGMVIEPLPLVLNPEQKILVKDGIEAVMRHSLDNPRSWWRERLGLPEENDGEGDEVGDEEGGEEDGEKDNTFLYFSSFFRLSLFGFVLLDMGQVCMGGVVH